MKDIFIGYKTSQKNKKIIDKEIIFWILFVLYEEFIFSILIFKSLPSSFLWITLFSLPLAIFLNIFTNIFKRKVNIFFSYVSIILIGFILGAQIVYYSMYDSIISFFSFVNGGQVTEFMDVIFDMILRNWYGIILFFIPIIALIIFIKTKILLFEKRKFKNILLKIVCIILIQILAITLINNIKDDSVYSNKNLYYNIHVPKLTVKKLGLFTAMRLDLQRYFSGFEEKIPQIDKNRKKAKEKKDIKYNMTIDNDKLNEITLNEQDANIKQIDEYIQNEMPTKQNKYTGMFKGKNLIVFVAEAFSSLSIREDLTPNLYKLYNEGFQFDNFYTPVFPVSTADGEYISDTSLIPKEGVWSIKRINGNYMPYSYANIFEQLGYSSNAYHNHTATYYARDQYIKTMGYNSYLAVGTGLEDRMNAKLWPNSDYEMMQVTMDDYIKNDKFVSYYMTVSGHLNYTRLGNSMVSRNWDKVKDLPYSDKAKSYLATQIELDKAIGETISRLKAENKLDDTVIVISGDHYPYGLTLSEMNELSTYQRDDTFEKYHMPLLIWSGSMKTPIKVEKYGSSLDILPTILNLFGVDYDSRLLIGKDILSDSDPLVIFSDRSFITDKRKIFINIWNFHTK